jgi:hypothetical protein
MNFAHLIQPCTVEQFFRDHYEKAFLFNQRHQPGYYNNVLNEVDLDLFFAQQDLNPAAIKLVNNGVPILQEQWTKVIERPVGIFKTVICPEKIFRHYYNGATIIINAAEKMIPGLTEACSAVERETRWLLQANVYITPPNSQGFSMHYDDHDIFTLQIKGPKKWRLYNTGEELPTFKKPFTKEPELVSEIELHSGDLLYMPRGLVHEAFTTAASTIHVNFSCKGLYGFHLLETLAKLAEEGDVFFRKMIPHGFSSEEAISHYKSLFTDKLSALLEKYGVETLLQRQQEKFTARQIIDFKGRLSDALALEHLNINSLLVKRKGFSFDLKKTADGTVISFREQTISISRIFDLAIFFQDQPFKVSDIKGLMTNNGKIAMVRTFVETGFLQIIDNLN